MDSVFSLLIIGIVALLGYFVPKKYNVYFNNKYHESAISMPIAIATAIFASLWLVFMDSSAFWYWALLIVSILLCVISVLYVIYIGWQVGASGFEIVFAIFAQLLAIAGVIIMIIGLLAFIIKVFGKNTKKRK